MEPRIWPSQPPSDCPFERSQAITGLAFTGRHAAYTGADTWYPSWGADDILYSPWTDGNFDWPVEQGWDVTNFQCSSDGRNPTNKGSGLSGTGQARIFGDDPLNLTLENLGVHYASPAPYGGRYPSASLMHNGIWYYGTYCLDETTRTTPDGRNLNWDVLGPFVGFRISIDCGKTWQDTPHTPEHSLFGESGKNGRKVKIGAPHAVDFGKNMAHSPDGKAYFVGHGATRSDANLSWISGDQVYLVRVRPAPDAINDASQYEFFAGHDGNGAPLWTRNFGDIRPLVEWNNRVGTVTVTYNAPLAKYVMCIVDGWPTVDPMSTYMLEADAMTGPWRLVTYMHQFGNQAYFVNIPSKFISDDGRTLWLCYSANFTNAAFGTNWKVDPPGSKYAMCLQEVKLLAD